MYDTILVPLDGSKRAETIIKHITKLAQTLNSKLILLTVVEPSYFKGSEEMVIAESFTAPEKETKKAETYLAKLQKKLVKNDIQVETKVITGSPVTMIKEIAEQENADLVTIASHGHGGLTRVFYGSVAAAVMNQVDRPLLIVRSRNVKE